MKMRMWTLGLAASLVVGVALGANGRGSYAWSTPGARGGRARNITATAPNHAAE